MTHAVARLRAARLALRTKPFIARGSRAERCTGCRVIASHCLCALRPVLPTHAGVCLIMADIEPLKPSNTGWLIADVVPDTAAFGWTRTAVDPGLDWMPGQHRAQRAHAVAGHQATTRAARQLRAAPGQKRLGAAREPGSAQAGDGVGWSRGRGVGHGGIVSAAIGPFIRRTLCGE